MGGLVHLNLVEIQLPRQKFLMYFQNLKARRIRKQNTRCSFRPLVCVCVCRWVHCCRNQCTYFSALVVVVIGVLSSGITFFAYMNPSSFVYVLLLLLLSSSSSSFVLVFIRRLCV